MKAAAGAILALLVASAATAPAQDFGPEGATALPLLDAYLAAAARATPAYRADIHPVSDAGPIPPGRALASSPWLGQITYRPKTFAELDPRQRLELLRSPGLHRYLAARSRALPAGSPPPRRVHFSVPPDEMRLGRPYRVNISP